MGKPAKIDRKRDSTRHALDVIREFSIEDGAGVDRLIHERLRLAIMSALAVNDVLSFNELKALLNASDGNLSVHARKLEVAGYIKCKKSFDGRTPRTEYRLTASGKRNLERYLGHMEALVTAMRDA